MPLRIRPWISPELADSDGLVGIGGDLSPTTLLSAYSEGIFPWFNDGDPILWWSPDPRGIIPIDGIHISRSLARTIRQGRFRVTMDQAFQDVMIGCATDREDGTWITDDMIEAYTRMHELGYAHSVEVWSQPQGEHADKSILAGGLYGVSIGGFFSAESMFHRVTDASKVALVTLTQHLQSAGFALLDIQIINDHTRSMGGIEIPREEYLQLVDKAIRKSEVRFI